MTVQYDSSPWKKNICQGKGFLERKMLTYEKWSFENSHKLHQHQVTTHQVNAKQLPFRDNSKFMHISGQKKKKQLLFPCQKVNKKFSPNQVFFFVFFFMFIYKALMRFCSTYTVLLNNQGTFVNLIPNLIHYLICLTYVDVVLEIFVHFFILK